MTSTAAEFDLGIDPAGDFGPSGVVEDYVQPTHATRDTDGWNGNSTRLTLAYPLIRDNAILKEGQTFIVEASFSEGQWRGPEAEHVADLIARGVIVGPSATQRRAMAGAVLVERAGVPDPSDPDATVVPGLHERTGEEVERTLGRMLAGGPRGMQAREKRELADATKELQETMAGFAQLMTGALQQIAGATVINAQASTVVAEAAASSVED